MPVGASLEDLGKGLRSQVGTMFSTKVKGVRYMEMAEGYILSMALDDERRGYRLQVRRPRQDAGGYPSRRRSAKEAYENNIGSYGRYDDAAKYIDPREE